MCAGLFCFWCVLVVTYVEAQQNDPVSHRLKFVPFFKQDLVSYALIKPGPAIPRTSFDRFVHMQKSMTSVLSGLWRFTIGTTECLKTTNPI